MLSIIIACKNSLSTIVRTFDSLNNLSNQDFFEVIVIDASDDNLIKDFVIERGKPNIKYFFSLDRSIYEAWNLGIERAMGDTIFFLNSDDYLFGDNFLELVYDLHMKGSYDITHARILYHVSDRRSKVKGGAIKAYRFVFGMDKTFLTLSALFKKDLFYRVGFFNTSYRISSDLDFIYRCLGLNNLRIRYTPVTIINMTRGGVSTSSRKEGMKEYGKIVYKYESVLWYFVFLFHEDLLRPMKKRVILLLRRT